MLDGRIFETSKLSDQQIAVSATLQGPEEWMVNDVLARGCHDEIAQWNCILDVCPFSKMIKRLREHQIVLRPVFVYLAQSSTRPDRRHVEGEHSRWGSTWGICRKMALP